MIQQQPVKKEQQDENQRVDLSLEQIASKGKFVLPGQVISDPSLMGIPYNSAVLKQIGDDRLTSLYAGYTTTINTKAKKNRKQNEDVSIASLLKFTQQYLPAKNDLVIGIIKVRASQHFIVDIGAPLDAILGALEFDGATKRNKPNLQPGTIVFCRISEYSKFMGARVSCINKGYNTANNVVTQADQGSKGDDMGELKGGLLTYGSPHMHKLLQKQVLQKVGKCAKFEVAFGRNGRIWVKASTDYNTNLISNMIGVIEQKGPSQGIPIVNKMISLIK